MLILSFDVGVKKLAYCLINNNKIIDWKVSDISASTYDKQCENLIKVLSTIELNELTNIVIEKQPGFNPKMRVISGQLQMYFAYEKYKNKNININKIVYYSAKHKLQCYKPKENDEPIIMNKYKSKYLNTKDLAKQYCIRMINNEDPKFIEYYNNNKKAQADLADCYLQGISYLNSK